MRRSTTLALALVSTAAVTLGIVGVAATRDGAPPDDVGEAVLAEPDTDTTAADPIAVPTPSIGVRSGRLEDLQVEDGPAPTRLAVPALGIDAPVVPMGVEDGGAVAVPDDVAVAGWYRFGPRPGEPGSAVVTAHVDSARQGTGAFFRLREAEPGAVVTVSYDDGSSGEFEVAGRRSYPKDTLPVDELFARDGEPVLTLVTCGGAFDPATRHYEENIVVFARPLAAP